MNTLYVDKQTLRNNIKIIRELAGNVKMCLPVKANAYGHGIELVVSATSDLVDYFAVANVFEAVRVAKISDKPVLIFGAIEYEYVDNVFKYDFRVSVQSYSDIVELEELAKKHNKKIKAHIKINTGMNRMGVDYKDAKKTIKGCIDSPFIDLEGVYSHLACADNKDHPANKNQKERFEDVEKYVKSFDKNVLCHLSNSYGLLGQKDICYDMVRTGIITYGYLPHFYVDRVAREIKPVARLVSKVVKIIKLDENDGVGYSFLYRGHQDEQIATLPIGYGDGYPRDLSDRGSVKIDGRIYPIAGRISMDALAVSLGTNRHNVKIGDEVEILSDIPRERNSVFSNAQLTNTIEYDIITTLNERIKRKLK